MPRYYFDTSDNGRFICDDVGVDLPDDEAARRHVSTFLPDVASNGLPNGDIRAFECTARNAMGDTVYSMTVTYRGWRTGPRTRDGGDGT